MIIFPNSEYFYKICKIISEMGIYFMTQMNNLRYQAILLRIIYSKG